MGLFRNEVETLQVLRDFGEFKNHTGMYIVPVHIHLILPFKSAVNFLNVLLLSGIFGRDIRCDINKRFTPRWQEVCGKYQK